MEAKKTTPKLQIKKPKGEIKQFASYGLMEWGEDESGKKFVRWHDTEWMPSILEYEEKMGVEENEEKKEEKEKEKENRFFIEDLFFVFFTTSVKGFSASKK